ncbi:MFS transporter [Propionicimonas paludicola]|uniref:MFS transporter n=1 Tax=Propionicimonas paludicola TaxID=185243 RepID=UPI000BFA377C|nr:MFS transporter [Propionicimonas paludicola]
MSSEESVTTVEERPGWRRDITLFLTGQTVSLFGSMLVQYAVMWYLTLTTKDGTVLALSTVFGFLPQAIISIFGGVWADRHNRKLLIIGADASIALATATLAILMFFGNRELWLIYAALAVRSAGAGIQTPAVGALLPQIVPSDRLLSINGINQSIQAGMMLIAPAVAALLYATLPLYWILGVDVVTAAIGIGLMTLIPVAKIVRSEATPTGYFSDLSAGFRYVVTHPLIRWLLGLYAVVMVLAAAPSFLTPLMVARSFGEEVWKLTVLELSFSIGMMLAGATIGSWGKRFSRIGLIVGASIGFGFLSIGMGLSSNLWVFYGFMFLTGVAVPVFSTPSMTVLQEVVEPDRQGRVFGFFGIVSATAMPVGMAVFGPLANLQSVEFVLILSGMVTLIVAAIALLLPSGRRAMRAARDHTDPLSHGHGVSLPTGGAEPAADA